jgi:hypothetical protein
MVIEPVIEFQPFIFIITFSITQLISIKYPDMKFFLMKKSKKLRLHHAFTAGLLVLFASLTGHAIWFNIGLGGMIQDIFNHSFKVLRKRLNF